MFLGRPHSLSIFGKLERKSLPTHKSAGPYDYGVATRHSPLSAIELMCGGCDATRPVNR